MQNNKYFFRDLQKVFYKWIHPLGKLRKTATTTVIKSKDTKRWHVLKIKLKSKMTTQRHINDHYLLIGACNLQLSLTPFIMPKQSCFKVILKTEPKQQTSTPKIYLIIHPFLSEMW